MSAVFAPDDTAVRFGLELRFWRERQGFTMKRLAALTGNDHSTLSRLEGGSRVPSRDLALKLADALYLKGPQRIRFLSLAGISEYPIDNRTATILHAWLQAHGITAD